MQRLHDGTLERWASTWQAGPQPPRDLIEVGNDLRRLVDPEYGLFHDVARTGARDRQAIACFLQERHVLPHSSPFLNAHCTRVRRDYLHRGQRVQMFSQGFHFDNAPAAEALGLVEAFERLFALEYCDPARVITASYAAVSESALNPQDFPLFAPHQYDQAGFLARPFTANDDTQWCWGVRVRDSKGILVPMDLVHRTASPIYLPSSNGAAAHSSFHHAVLNGIYETIERDALMIAWLNNMSFPRLAIGDGDYDPHGLRAAMRTMGFRLTHVDLTTDLDIPVVLAVVQDDLDPNFFLMTMAAGLDRNVLIDKLYKELAMICYPHFIDRRFFRSSLGESDDPSLVHTFTDHVHFHQSAEKIRRAAFLTASTTVRRFNELPDHPLIVEDELHAVLERLQVRGYDAIVVDCSPPMLRPLGLYAVKTLIPGLQPIYAGHGYAPLGGRRLFELPRRLGMAEHDTSIETLNPWPHPLW